MARPSTSLELSEYFCNDDSDGQRLAEFLQKRRGGVQKPNFLFMNCESQRLSYNVQLEKLPPSQQHAISENNEKQIENVNNVGSDPVEHALATLHGDIEGAPTLCSNNDTNQHVPKVSNVHPLPSEGVTPISPDKPHSSIKPVSPRPQSPRLSSIRKSGGVSSSDRLRRYSLKRLTNICVGRRTLLQEFDSVDSGSNFNPPVCSTPLSQPQPDKTPSSSPCYYSPGAENLVPNGTEKNDATNESCRCHSDTLIRTLQRKDEELKNYMENIVENTIKNIQSQEKQNSKSTSQDTQTKANLPATNSQLKRIYTVENGNTPGQVILTPDRATNHSPPHSRLLRSQTDHSPCKILKTPELRVNRSSISIKVKSPQNFIAQRFLNNSITHRGSKMQEVSSYLPQQEQQAASPKITEQVQNTPPRNNMSIIFPSQGVEIPETQDALSARENSIIIQSDNAEMPLVVIPVNQTYNRTYDKEPSSNNTIITARTKSKNQTNIISKNENEPTSKPSDGQCNQLAEDNLKLTDILTDDDEEISKATVSCTIENNSQTPLNLAPIATNTRTKRLRKRSILRRKLQIDHVQLLSTETETEVSRRRTVKRKHIPLNKAPGTPLNGEKFAPELARMSNYEILDLRKRNSMGRVFVISGRKSVRSHEEAVKKQHQLDDQIEMELLKRNVEESTDTQHTQNEQVNVEEVIERLPAPEEFRDSLDKQQNTENKSRESSLVNEKSTDRISFKSKNILKQSKLSSKSNNKRIPEELKQYLEVSEKLTQKKKTKNSINKSKRSLYTQGHSDFEETNGSIDKSTLENTRLRSKIRKQSIPYVPSPPQTDVDKITTLKVVSPPPPLNISPSKYLPQSRHVQLTDEIEKNTCNTNTTINAALPPPPPGFESDSGFSSNHYNIHFNTNNALQTDQQKTLNNTPQLNRNNSHTDNDDEQIFKKPLQEADKIGRKKNVSKILSNNLVQTTSISQETADNSANATDSTGTINVSKRGHYNTNNSLQKDQEKTINKTQQLNANNSHTDNDDEEIFKKPLQVAAKRGRKKNVSKIPSNDLQQSTSDSQETADNSANATDGTCTVSISKRGHFNTLKTDQEKTINKTQQLNANNSHTDNDHEEIIKKPLQVAAKRGRKKNVSKIPSNDLEQSTSDSQEKADNSANATDDTCTVRRSKRGHVPLKQPIPIFQLLFQQTFNRRLEKIAKNEKKKKKSRVISNANKDNHCKDSIQLISSQKTAKTSRTGIKQTQFPTVPENDPPPVDHLNIIFDQLRSTSSTTTLNTSSSLSLPQPSTSRNLIEKVKPFRVRVARLKSSAYDSVRVSSTSTQSKNNNSNFELISWLKHISDSDSSVAYNEENNKIFKEMRISAGSNLSFTELQGVEYAFYNTNETASLGYLRFKPRQIKPQQRSKSSHLHFITMVGNFVITASDKESRIGVGDMVAIEKSVTYGIENITDDMGILMVVKK